MQGVRQSLIIVVKPCPREMLTFQSEHFNTCTLFLDVGEVLGLINRDGCFVLLGVDFGELLY